MYEHQCNSIKYRSYEYNNNGKIYETTKYLKAMFSEKRVLLNAI